MHIVDYAIVTAYLGFMVGIGLMFAKRQTGAESYFVGDRSMGPGHIGFSVVATDVGGGFSIGLGGLGFSMGIAGSWLLFTGLIGAWVTAVVLIPRVKALGDEHGWLSFPDFLGHRYGAHTRLLATLVSAIGYAGFVGAQILAGAKLASVAFEIDLTTAVWVMALVVVGYTALGGLQAVVYTDTIQWGILLLGLAGVAVPFGYDAVGGLAGMRAALPASHFALDNLDAHTAVVWLASIVPIWFVGNTLYQRIYASRDLTSARRAWFMAGLLEWPVMAVLGATLGMFARVLFPEAEAELGLPMLIREVLPAGVVGVVLATYFAAIMSTADSCLLASAGHVVTDVYQKHVRPAASDAQVLRVSRQATLVIGLVSTAVALALPRVLDAILLAYAFMVSGLFVPTIAALLSDRVSGRAAFWSMLCGGSTAIVLSVVPAEAWPTGWDAWLGAPVLVAIPLAAIVLVAVSALGPDAGARHHPRKA